MGRLVLEQQDTQAAPATGDTAIYVKTDGDVYKKNSAGTESPIADGATPGDHAASHKGGGSDVIDSATTSVAGLMAGADKTKLNGIATGADVTGSNAPQAHKTSHENGGGDKISVAGLSGVLADGQPLGTIDGDAVVITTPGRRDHLCYDEVAEEWFNQKLPTVPHTKVICHDWEMTWEDIEDDAKFVACNTDIALPSHVGNGTVAYLNGISATTGDTYTVTDSGTLTAGSLAVTPGTIVMWYAGVAWVRAVAGSSEGNVYAGIIVMLSTSTPLISPYTDGTDDGKLIGFRGDDLVGEETSQDITITLPDSSELPFGDGSIRGMYYVGKMSVNGSVTVKVADTSNAFMDGLEGAVLTKKMTQITTACVYAALAGTWMRISFIPDTLQVRRAATWASSNFTSAAAIPFDTVDETGNPYISTWSSSTNPSRLTAIYASTYTFSGIINIDTTGGGAWLFECWLRKNGTTEIPGSRIRTGNYQEEDMAVALSSVEVDMVAGDYMEWVADHNNLTGTLFSATMIMSTNS